MTQAGKGPSRNIAPLDIKNRAIDLQIYQGDQREACNGLGHPAIMVTDPRKLVLWRVDRFVYQLCDVSNAFVLQRGS